MQSLIDNAKTALVAFSAFALFNTAKVIVKYSPNLIAEVHKTTHAATVTQPEQEKVWECVLINPERTVCYVWLHVPTGRYYKLNVEGRYEQTANPLP